MAIGLRYISNRDEAEDVVQDSFVKILTSIEEFRFQGEGSLKSWISRIVAHKAVDSLRKSERVTFISAVPDTPEEEEQAEETAIERVPPDVLTRMIANLPSGYRMILNMHVFEHCTHKEIAQRLGIKEKSSASQFSRAKQLLTNMMEEYLKQNQI